MDTNVNPDPANGTTVPTVGIAAAIPKPMPIGKRVTLAAVGTLGVAAALGLGGTIQVVAAPSSVPGSTVIALGPCFGPHREPIPCPPFNVNHPPVGPGGTVGGNEGYTGGDYPEPLVLLAAAATAPASAMRSYAANPSKPAAHRGAEAQVRWRVPPSLCPAGSSAYRNWNGGAMTASDWTGGAVTYGPALANGCSLLDGPARVR